MRSDQGGKMGFIQDPLYTPSCYNRHFAYGEFRRRRTGTRMIVTSGLGNLSLPWRLRCRREVVFIRFTGR